MTRLASGLPYPQYVVDRILTPLGMSSTGFEPLGEALAGRCATGYSARAFSDELAMAPVMPRVWAEGGLWSTVEDLARWLSFQLAAHGEESHEPEPSDPGVLASATRREMHKPRYLSDEEWTTAWGVSWYAVRMDGVTWVQHSGGLPGFKSNACFDRDTRVGAIALVNGIADASALAMSMAAAGRGLAKSAAPSLRMPTSTPADVAPLLGVYAPANMGALIKLEWRDGKLALLDAAEPGQPIAVAVGEPGSFVVAPGFRESGEPVEFLRRPDGRVVALLFGGDSLVRLDPVT